MRARTIQYPVKRYYRLFGTSQRSIKAYSVITTDQFGVWNVANLIIKASGLWLPKCHVAPSIIESQRGRSVCVSRRVGQSLYRYIMHVRTRTASG